MSQTLPRQRWTVRAGSTGTGSTLFEVYATTMEEARASVKRTAEETGDASLRILIRIGFTVHAIGREDTGADVLVRNPWARTTPAPDFSLEPARAA
ncbi:MULTISPECIES: hypothetical protein [unclassified Nonomuraea]|uniref:hypothetical protein n=1 Tax=unclassified Nonomuraea TaxID=2593643 RepID=UPI0033F2FE2C